jgi:hypothetical protein
MARAGVLARQAARQKTGQVSVNFPGRHVTCRRQFSQRDWPLRARKMVEELTGDLDGFDAPAIFACHSRCLIAQSECRGRA